jgi:tRNA (cytosine38-C5)-methyltransferase
MTYGPTQNSHTRQILLSTLKSLGYTTIELLLTPLEFRIPNSRLRYYLLAKTKPLSFSCSQSSDDHIWRHIPGHGVAWVDPRFLDDRDANSVDELSINMVANVYSNNPHLHAVPDRVLRKWGRLFDIVLPSSRRSCCFTRGSYLL